MLHSRPYHPQTLGKLERFHRSLKGELLAGTTFTDLDHCQRAFDTWRSFYNLERPHHALDLDTPITRYTPSPRHFPETLSALAYAPDDQVRSVDVSGRISFQGNVLAVGKAFRHKRVALRPTQTDGVWDVYFSIQRVKSLDLRKQHLVPISPNNCYLSTQSVQGEGEGEAQNENTECLVATLELFRQRNHSEIISTQLPAIVIKQETKYSAKPQPPPPLSA